MQYQRGRPASITYDHARGNRLKYHAAYAANPTFGETEAQVVPLEQSYGHSRILAGVERDSEGRLIALANVNDGDNLVDDQGSGAFLGDLQASMNMDALTSYEGALTQATSLELRALMSQAARDGGPMAPVHGAPIDPSHARQISAATNPTYIPEGEHTGYMTDRYEDGTPGMGDEYPPDDRDPYDHRPFVQHEGRRQMAGMPCPECGGPTDRSGACLDMECGYEPYNDPRDPMFQPENHEGLEDPMDPSLAHRRQRMAPGRRQQRPTFRPQMARQQAPVPPRQRPTVATLQAEASHLLEQAEMASSRGMHGKAALLERKADRIIAQLEASRPRQPRRPTARTAGFMESTTEMPLDDDEVGSGFGGY